MTEEGFERDLSTFTWVVRAIPPLPLHPPPPPRSNAAEAAALIGSERQDSYKTVHDRNLCILNLRPPEVAHKAPSVLFLAALSCLGPRSNVASG